MYVMWEEMMKKEITKEIRMLMWISIVAENNNKHVQNNSSSV